MWPRQETDQAAIDHGPLPDNDLFQLRVEPVKVGPQVLGQPADSGTSLGIRILR